MRKRTPFNIALILLMSMLIGLVFMAMFHACTPQITMALPCPDVPAPTPDTVLRISTRTVTDTFTLPGATITVLDSFPCPPGLQRDSTIYVTRTRTLPAQVLYVPRTIHDTVRVVTQAQGHQTAIDVAFWPLLLIVVGAVASLIRAFVNRKKGAK